MSTIDFLVAAKGPSGGAPWATLTPGACADARSYRDATPPRDGRRSFQSGPRSAPLAELARGVVGERSGGAEALALQRWREAVESEVSRRIGATLHDGLGQTLQAINLGLKQARSLVGRGQCVSVGLLDCLVAEAAEALDQVRTLSHDLRSPVRPRLSLTDAIERHVRVAASCAGRDIRVHIDHLPCALSGRVVEQCFLAFREALSNALRHAFSEHVWVRVRVGRQGAICILIVDDGIGLPPRLARGRRPGLGLGLIRERIEAVQGSVRIRSRPGRGTAVRIQVPPSRERAPCN